LGSIYVINIFNIGLSFPCLFLNKITGTHLKIIIFLICFIYHVSICIGGIIYCVFSCITRHRFSTSSSSSTPTPPMRNLIQEENISFEMRTIDINNYFYGHKRIISIGQPIFNDLISTPINEENKKEIYKCAICLSDCDSNFTKTPCDHVYHQKCLIDWLNVKNDCPICKRIVLLRNYNNGDGL
jgi:hypothetical protein